MPQRNHEPIPAETGEQVPARPHDSGSQANETVDGLDAGAEALRKAAEDTPSGAVQVMSKRFRCLTGRIWRQKSSKGAGA